MAAMLRITRFLVAGATLLAFTKRASSLECREGERLIPVDLQVADTATGRIFSEWDSADFEIRDGDTLRAIAIFHRDELPLDVVLVVEATGAAPWSRTGPGQDNLVRGLRRLLEELWPGDRLGMVAMSPTRVTVYTALTGDREIARASIQAALRERLGLGPKNARAPADRPPLLYEALDDAARLFWGDGLALRRRAVLVLTHNRSHYNAEARQMAARALWAGDVVVVGS